jgi:hypothetical protein
VIDMRDDLSPLKAPATIDAEAVLTSGLRKHGS